MNPFEQIINAINVTLAVAARGQAWALKENE
jgi:hypothetical protein